MGDRTYARLIVHRWPKGKKQREAVAIIAAFVERGMSELP